MFRTVQLPAQMAGQLFLHSMPGRLEPLANFLQAAEGEKLTGIICLTSLAEIWVHSLQEARQAVKAAGSSPEVGEQWALLAQHADY